MIRRLALAVLIGCSAGEPTPVPAAPAPCAAEIATCDRDADCRNFTACTSKCASSDDACRTQCRVALPRGYGEAAVQLQGCLARTCEKDCGATCGGYIADTAECGTCVRGKCCAELAACQADRECAALQACERTCHGYDRECLGGCERSHPTAANLAATASECVAQSCEHSCVPLKWRCLNDPAPTVPLTKTSFTLVLLANEFGSGKGMPGVTMRACSGSDYFCSTPLTDTAVSDATGRVTLKINQSSFNGYIEMKGEQLVPSLWFLGEIKNDFDQGILMIDVATFAVLTGALGTPRDDRGHILMTTFTCAGTQASGVRFAIDPMDDAIGAYFIDRTPSKTATMTDSSGNAGFMNVRPLTGIKITGTVVDFGLKLPERSVFTRAGWIARVHVPAQPR
jgi:hypothetical protein